MRNDRTKNSGYLPPDKYLTNDEVTRLRRAVCVEADQARENSSKRGLVNWMLIELMLETGLRAEEVCCLQLRDMPTHHGKDVVLVRRGKGDVLRTVNVKQCMKDKVAEYIRLCRKGAKSGSPLFTSEWGLRLLRCRKGSRGKITRYTEKTARLSYHELYMKVRRLGKRAGIAGLSPHKLRHTFATFLYSTERDLRYTQLQMGHSTPTTTSRYARVFDAVGRRQTESLYSADGRP